MLLKNACVRDACEQCTTLSFNWHLGCTLPVLLPLLPQLCCAATIAAAIAVATVLYCAAIAVATVLHCVVEKYCTTQATADSAHQLRKNEGI